MPVTHFRVRWPDAGESRCYSPSSVVREHFAPGERYARDEFLRRAREALGIASERVRARYGFACSQAMDQLAEIERIAARFEPGAEVTVLAFD
ncbi:MSMEG_0570 family nitrogen starvation response protein [Variovorax sp. 1615]|uniref:MSMEG_0570 family nitrogen starvation response protein n=1 Tax=Variovorax sp. UC122_21 TaxID=3374554 RepID=UPI001AE6F460